MQPELMSVAMSSNCLPVLPTPMVPRDNITQAIEDATQDGTQLVVLEGEEGAGKSTILAEFAWSRPNHVASMFISGTDRWSYQADMVLRDLCAQINWAVNGTDIPSSVEVNTSLWVQLIYSLQTKLKKARRNFYFVVDGIEEIPDNDAFLRDEIMSLIPISRAPFVVITSIRTSETSDFESKSVRTKRMTLTNFSLEETRQLFSEVTSDNRLIESLHKTFRGHPGRLSEVRRIFSEQEESIRKLFDDVSPDDIFPILDLQWNDIELNDLNLSVMTILAHDKRRYTVESISSVLDVDREDMLRAIDGIDILYVDKNDGFIYWVSEIMHRHVKKRTEYRKNDALRVVIQGLLDQIDDPNALRALPGYLSETGQYQELLDFLSAEHISRLIEVGRSLSPIRSILDLGVAAASKLGQDVRHLQFSLQKAAVTEFASVDVDRLEVEARLALHDYVGAMGLAQSAATQEDRLHLLAMIAKGRKAKGMEVSQDISEEIDRLLMDIDPEGMPNKVVSIASDLLYWNPGKAIEFIERATGGAPGGNALDLAFLRLSMAAHEPEGVAGEGEFLLDRGVVSQIEGQIKGSVAKEMSSAVAILMDRYTAAEILEEIGKIEGIGRRLYLLRHWIRAHHTDDQVLDVIAYAVAEMIAEVTYSPNATVIADLAEPLVVNKPSQLKDEILGSLSSQAEAVRQLGPSEDFVRLQLSLANAEFFQDIKRATERLVDLVLFIEGIDDLSVSAVCLAMVKASIARIDPGDILEDDEGLHSEVATGLNSRVDDLLAQSAYQSVLMNGVIGALAQTFPHEALSLASRLNTEERRDSAYVEIVERYSRLAAEDIAWPVLSQAFACIVSDDEKGSAVTDVIVEWSSRLADDPKLGDYLQEVAALVEELLGGSGRCFAYAVLFTESSVLPSASSRDKVLEWREHLTREWGKVPAGWPKVSLGLQLCTKFADVDQELARAILKDVEQDRLELVFSREGDLQAFRLCIQLAIRAFGGLIRRKVVGEEEFARLSDLIESVPSDVDKLVLWSNFSMLCFNKGAVEWGRRIVEKRIVPILNAVDAGDQHLSVQMRIVSAPVMFRYHNSTGMELVASMPQPYRDQAYESILHFLAFGCSIAEPYENLSRSQAVISYINIKDMIHVMERMEYDQSIYTYLVDIVDSLCSSRAKSEYAVNQRLEILQSLRRLVSSVFPSTRRIRHDGFLIASLGQIERAELNYKSKNVVALEGLVVRAHAIPNVSDRLFVLGILATCYPSSRENKRREILDEVISEVETIGSLRERVEILHRLAVVTYGVVPQFCKRMVEMAMTETVSQRSRPGDYKVKQRQLIDMAFRIDPNIAASVASLADDDEARDGKRSELKDRIERLQLEARMSDPKGERKAKHDVDDIPLAAWSLLGKLNAGRLATVHTSQLLEYVERVASLPLSRSYPVMAWAVENMVRRMEDSDQAETMLKWLFEATMISSALAREVAARDSNGGRRTFEMTGMVSQSGGLIVRQGDREAAISFLRQWMVEHLGDTLKICDPYFAPEQLELLRMVQEVNPECQVLILTSMQAQSHIAVNSSLQEAFDDFWRYSVSEQPPPDTDVIVVSSAKGTGSPIHDRWWITETSGLRLGTSFNSIGDGKVSEISILEPDRAAEIEAEMDIYFSRRKRDGRGGEWKYVIFRMFQ